MQGSARVRSRRLSWSSDLCEISSATGFDVFHGDSLATRSSHRSFVSFRFRGAPRRGPHLPAERVWDERRAALRIARPPVAKCFIWLA